MNLLSEVSSIVNITDQNVGSLEGHFNTQTLRDHEVDFNARQFASQPIKLKDNRQ